MPAAIPFHSRLTALRRFRRAHGHTRVSSRADAPLAAWCVGVRTLNRRGQLSSEQRKALDALGFEWDPGGADWDAQFARLRTFVRKHGREASPFRVDPPLYVWLTLQRERWRKKTLGPDEVKRLRKLGLDAHPDRAWEARYQALRRFHAKHGHCEVAASKDRVLAQWCINQRTARRRNVLPAERIRELDRLDFPWSPQDSRWYANYSKLLEYRAIHGDCEVLVASGPLGRWVQHQRSQNRHGTLLSWRKQLLDRVGFRWRVATNLRPIRKASPKGRRRVG